MFWKNFFYDLAHSPLALLSFSLFFIYIVIAICAPWISPFNPWDPSSYNIFASELPSLWEKGGRMPYILGTDLQGMDMLSAIFYGLRLSIFISLSAITLAVTFGTIMGMIAAWRGGWTEVVIMRVVDIQLTFPAFMTAILVAGVLKVFLGARPEASHMIMVLIASIAMSRWTNFARLARSAVLVEKNKEYVQSARLLGRSAWATLFYHILPNILGPIFIIMTIDLGVAIALEATLSFLNLGVPPTMPSLGTLINSGRDVMRTKPLLLVYPTLALVLLVMSINLIGDFLRDCFNPTEHG
ncbi:MAG: ABC transporter permease [Alphaproteobacteria bacterium]